MKFLILLVLLSCSSGRGFRDQAYVKGFYLGCISVVVEMLSSEEISAGVFDRHILRCKKEEAKMTLLYEASEGA